ncbi:MAG: glycoside hydrolase [Flavobacteriaceae bacterium]|nr:MAG: glycoside hydrolase [Flavobacteriaceae bacterium]
MKLYLVENIKTISNFILCLFISIPCCYSQNKVHEVPIRSFSISAPKPSMVKDFIKFIEEDLSNTPVNTLFLKINYQYQFNSHPELVDNNALSKKDVKQIVNTCQQNNINLIPLINLLGHQSWKQDNIKSLLRVYPEFEENPGNKLHDKDFYCRSYCPLHPEVHAIVFDLLDELIEVFEATGVHVGMDEVFILGEDGCSRCKGKDKAVLFADEVSKIYRHLNSKNLTMYMWGDRLLDGETTGLGKWTASKNATYPAIDLIPKDIVICDWQYKTAPPTPAYFALKGFQVISCSYQVPEVAAQQLQSVLNIRKFSNPTIKNRLLGVMHTYWGSFDSFYACYKDGNCSSDKIEGAIKTFKSLYH